MALSPDMVGQALESVARWRADPETPVPCPACGEAGLTIVDRSARPYAEWYYLNCARCGLEETLHVPMSPPSNTLD
jgi:predicted RNA-binding Zn-ribbon protein involved in translation (DUF1610 family)